MRLGYLIFLRNVLVAYSMLVTTMHDNSSSWTPLTTVGTSLNDTISQEIVPKDTSTVSDLSYNALNGTIRLKKGLRIFGGQLADLGMFPYQVALKFKDDSVQEVFCAGTIIKAGVILTAAHCCEGMSDGRQVFVTAGDIHWNRLQVPGTESLMQEVLAVAWLMHPKYDKRTLMNDLCLLKLKSDLKIGKRQNTAILEPNSLLPISAKGTKECTVAGWGATEESAMSDWLVYTDVELIPDEVCLAGYGATGYDPTIMICAGDTQGKKDSCFGDSGGPLVCQGKLIGVVSFGQECGSKTHPGVYVKLSKYQDWIMSTDIPPSPNQAGPNYQENLLHTCIRVIAMPALLMFIL